MLAAPLDESMLIVKEIINETPDNGLLGASEYEIWLCQALRAGQFEIALKYVRPWEKDLAPLRTHVFKVLVQ
jgi:predicted secreted protein